MTASVNTASQSLPRPDLSKRPHQLIVERDMKASPAMLYEAWTQRFDMWFAVPGVIRMRPEVGEPFFFETHHEGGRHAHYGRFLALERERLVELTWMTGEPGTRGAETVVSVELRPKGKGTHLRLTHAGFYDARAVKQHDSAWLEILGSLDQQLVPTSP